MGTRHLWRRRDMHTGLWQGYPSDRHHFKATDIHGNILQVTLKKQNGRAWTGLSGTAQGKVAGSCENGNEHSASITSGTLSVNHRTYNLLNKDSAPRFLYLSASQLVGKMSCFYVNACSDITQQPQSGSRKKQSVAMIRHATSTNPNSPRCCYGIFEPT